MSNTPPNFQGLAMDSHIFSPPPRPGTPAPQTPTTHDAPNQPPQTPKMHPTTKESLFSRLGRKIAKSSGNKSVQPEHDSTNAGSISQEKCTVNGWSDTLTYVATNTAANDCYVTSNPEQFYNNNYVSSPVTKLANLLNEKLIINGETPGVLPLSSTPPPTTTAVVSANEPRASSCPASTAVTPSTKSSPAHAVNGTPNKDLGKNYVLQF